MIYNAAIGNDLTAIYGPLASIVDITDTTGYGDLVSEDVINYISDTYAEGMGPWKDSFLLREPLDTPVDFNGDGVAQLGTRLTGEIHPLLSRAINAGLLVHPYTLRSEEGFLTVQANGIPQTVVGEIVQLLSLGVTGFFVDQPVDGVRARREFLELNDPSLVRQQR